MTRKKRITYIVSNIDKALTFEWAAELLDTDRFSVTFILLNPGDAELERFCQRTGVPVNASRMAGVYPRPRLHPSQRHLPPRVLPASGEV